MPNGKGKPKMVFLLETKLQQNKMEVIKAKASFDNVFTMDCVGRSGGLALLWNNEEGVKIQNYNHHHIDEIAKPLNEGETWKFTGFMAIRRRARGRRLGTCYII
jgi:hypothetical protein